uniref:Uncharacterized protein n=1 Tax=Zooxanthella nutricula TaxID=1333877 RepID=A0A7S2PKY9_9DINO
MRGFPLELASPAATAKAHGCNGEDEGAPMYVHACAAGAHGSTSRPSTSSRPTAAADVDIAVVLTPSEDAIPLPRWQRPAARPPPGVRQGQVDELLRDEDLDGAEAALLQIVSDGIEPTQEILGGVCKRLSRKGEVYRIQVIMDTLELFGCTLNEGIFSSLVFACGAAQPQRLARVEQAVHDMVARGLKLYRVERVVKYVLGKRRTRALFDTLPESAIGKSRDGHLSAMFAPRKAAAGVPRDTYNYLPGASMRAVAAHGPFDDWVADESFSREP